MNTFDYFSYQTIFIATKTLNFAYAFNSCNDKVLSEYFMNLIVENHINSLIS
jgi:hypothetical protein